MWRLTLLTFIRSELHLILSIEVTPQEAYHIASQKGKTSPGCLQLLHSGIVQFYISLPEIWLTLLYIYLRFEEGIAFHSDAYHGIAEQHTRLFFTEYGIHPIDCFTCSSDTNSSSVVLARKHEGFIRCKKKSLDSSPN